MARRPHRLYNTFTQEVAVLERPQITGFNCTFCWFYENQLVPAVRFFREPRSSRYPRGRPFARCQRHSERPYTILDWVEIEVRTLGQIEKRDLLRRGGLTHD